MHLKKKSFQNRTKSRKFAQVLRQVDLRQEAFGFATIEESEFAAKLRKKDLLNKPQVPLLSESDKHASDLEEGTSHRIQRSMKTYASSKSILDQQRQ